MAVSSLALVPIEDQIFIDKMIHKRLGHAGALLGILEDVQARPWLRSSSKASLSTKCPVSRRVWQLSHQPPAGFFESL